MLISHRNTGLPLKRRYARVYWQVSRERVVHGAARWWEQSSANVAAG